ncbi:MAG: TIM barrel protein [Deltaproteobacteria bacterium]|jgi:sugar phosphate isomerase/epimerase|nr:TIM barrel protein [Deltaproteobacteria bacterium]
MPPVFSHSSRIYATTYLRSLRLRDEHFQTLKTNGLRPEIYFQFGWDKLSFVAHKQLAEIVRNEFSGCAVHLPYDAQMKPGEENDRELTLDALRRSLELAELYAPDHLIGHVYFDSLTDSILGVRKFYGLKNGPLDAEHFQPGRRFLDLSLEYWRIALENSEAALYLENTHEHSPLPICVLTDLLLKEGLTEAASPHPVGICLDIGHWFHYAMGLHWDNLVDWLALLGTRVKHLHVHDNNGESDQHLGLGQAKLDLPFVWKTLQVLTPPPNFTLENHRLDGLLCSLAYLQKKPLF